MCLATKASGLWGMLEQQKAVVQEPRGTGEAFDAAMADFYAAIDSSRGCLFFAVCRGKVPLFKYLTCLCQVFNAAMADIYATVYSLCSCLSMLSAMARCFLCFSHVVLCHAVLPRCLLPACFKDDSVRLQMLTCTGMRLCNLKSSVVLRCTGL